jgi:protein-S-isoprenylcysteine O-methyltransferase Ste14
MTDAEELAGKLLLAAIFCFFAVIQILVIVDLVKTPPDSEYWEIILAARIANLIFLSLMSYLTMTRLPPTNSATGLEPRISAIAGTFSLLLLVIVPHDAISPALVLFSTILILAGTTLSVYCLHRLGGAFSIMATARKLVTHGPYRFVRHPLYLAEAVSAVGIIISNWSITAMLIGIAYFAFQFRRMYNEERILRMTFPEYSGYASTVPMLIPLIWTKN